MKNVVFIVSTYYPQYSAVSKCIGNIADILCDEYSINVIAIRNSTELAENRKHVDQNIHRITTKSLYKRMIIQESMEASTSRFQHYILSLRLQAIRAISYLKMLVSKNSMDKDLVCQYKGALDRIPETIDCIIPACTPFESIMAALLYKEEQPNTIIAPFLFDLFADNPRLHRANWNKRAKWKSNIELEKRVFDESLVIFHVSNWKQHLRIYHPEYISKTVELEHPLLLVKETEYDKDKYYESASTGEMTKTFPVSINKTSVNLREGIDPSNDKRIIYAGALLHNYVEPVFPIKVFSSKILSDYRVDFFSTGTATCFVKKSKCDRIQLRGWISRDELELEYKKAYCFLSISEKTGKQLSSKIFDYMSYGKPIIHFYFTDDDVNLKYISQYPLGLYIKADSRRIQESTEMIFKFLNSNPMGAVKVCMTSVLKNLYECTPQYVSKKIVEEIKQRNARLGGQ